MKKTIQYTTILFVGLSLFSCKNNSDKEKTLATNQSKITIDKALNSSIKYGVAYDIDSNEYKTVKIGKYEWFAQNLQVTKLNDSTPITNITDNKAWTAAKEPAYSNYNNSTDVTVNGLLYNHKTVATKKICPQGWEVASDSAWLNLADAFNGTDKAAIALKSANNWSEQKATNESGFSALASGFRENNGEFNVMGEIGLWWSANEHNENNSMYFFIDKNTSLNHSHIDRKKGLSIRCVKEIK